MVNEGSTKDMVGFEEARGLMLRSVSPLPREYVQLSRSAGRALAEDLKARVDVPLNDISLRDGYALIAIDTLDASSGKKVRLELAGESLAGIPTDAVVKSGQAVAVNTGAVVPESADAVVASEDVEAGEGEIFITQVVEKGDFVVNKGEEFRERDPILVSGALLDVGHIASLIAGGHVEVHVTRRPRVYVLASGDELRSAGRDLSPGQGYPGVAYGITAVIEEIGVDEIRVELVPDEKEAILEAVPDPGAVDLIITTGGTGHSSRDLVVTDLKSAGVAFLFHGVKMRPCHSMAFGIMEKNIPVICLPGGPSAAELGFYQFVLPVLMKLCGHTDFDLPKINAKIERDVSSPPGQRHFVRATLERDESSKGLIARPLRRKKIYQEMVQSHGFIVIPEDKELVKEGEDVLVEITKREWSGPIF